MTPKNKPALIDISPGGWRYGFPRPYDFEPSHPNLPGEEQDREFRDWLVDCGYPRELLRDGNYILRFIGGAVTQK